MQARYLSLFVSAVALTAAAKRSPRMSGRQTATQSC